MDKYNIFLINLPFKTVKTHTTFTSNMSRFYPNCIVTEKKDN